MVFFKKKSIFYLFVIFYINYCKEIVVHKNDIEDIYSNNSKCSDFINNCKLCNNNHCILCKDEFIFINDNFLKCVPKESINLDFYITNDNITYYSCKKNKYKNLEKCKKFLLDKDLVDDKNNSLIESQKTEPNITKIHEICNELFPEGEPGAGVLIMQDEKIIFEEYYGLANLPEGSKIDKDTRFNIASVSKQFTAIAILQLVDKGKLLLEDTMDKYFPEYTHPLWKKVTVKHLLSHSSGISDERGYIPREKKIYGDENLALEYFQWLENLHFEPGTSYEYCNPTYILLGRLIEKISGQNFTDFVKENIFTPANMTQTAYIGEEQNAAHAYEYNRESGDTEESQSERPEGTHEWYEYDYGEETFFGTRPDGGIYTTPRDFVKWELELKSLLSKDLLQEAFQPHIYVYGSNWSDYQNRPGTWYGYGWFIEPQKQCIYHTGDNGGFKILASRYPENKTLVLAFAARTDWDRYDFKTKIEQILHFKSKTKIQTRVIFILQFQMINKKLKIFATTNFGIPGNKTFKFPVIIYSKKLDGISQNKEEKDTEFVSMENYDGKADKIIELISKEEFGEESVASLQNSKNSNYDFELKLNENQNYLDTDKVKKEIEDGATDYNNISLNYEIYHYYIKYATQGCDFSLNTLENIKIQNKNINLKFIELDNDNIIKAKCELSNDNINNIFCKLDKSTNKNYILEPYIYSDSNKTITISQFDTNNYLMLNCSISPDDENNKNNSKDRALSTAKILGIIFGVVGVFIIAAIAIYIIIYNKNKKENDNNNNYSTILPENELENK